MDSNFISFCFAFFLLVHMSMGIFTGSRNSDKFTINKIASSSTGEKNVEKPVIRSKRGFDYSDYFSGSSEENNFGYYHKPQYQAFPSHWPHHAPHHVLVPTSNTGGYDTWQQGPSRPPYHHGKYHLYFHDKKYVSKNRKRRNTISVDDVDDQENDAVFPSRPLFISKGHTGSPKPIAIPLSVDIAAKQNKGDSFSVGNIHGLENDATPLSRPISISKVHTSSDRPLAVISLSTDIAYGPQKEEEVSINSNPPISNEDYNENAFESFTNQLGRHKRSGSAQINVDFSAKLPIPIFGRHVRPPPPFHRRRPPPYHRPPPPHPPHSHHNQPPPGHRGPPPPLRDTNYAGPPPPDTNIREDYVLDKAPNRDVQENSSTKESINEKIDAIFGTNTSEEPDISSLIDVRKQD